MAQDSEDQEVTLQAFIEDNYRLLSALAIFTALTVFATSISLEGIRTALSFLFLTETILIWFELWASFPSKSGTTRLAFFEIILLFATLVVVFYWLVEFRAVWHHYLFVLISGIVLWVISTLMKRFDLFNRLFRTEPGGRKILRYILGVALASVVMFVTYFVTARATPSINTVLDEVYKQMKSPAP